MLRLEDEKMTCLSFANTVNSGNSLHKAVLSESSTPGFIRSIVRAQPQNVSGLNVHENTPLHLAVCYNPRVDIIRELLKLGAEPNSINYSKNNPLDCTVYKYIQDLFIMMDILIKHKAEVDRMNWNDFLSKSENINESDLLLLLNCPNDVPRTDVIALQQALRNMTRYAAVAKLLLEFGAEPDSLLLETFKELKVISSTVRLTKLLLQYLMINNLERGLLSSANRYELYNFLDDDPIDDRVYRAIQDFGELLTFRNLLVDQLIAMIEERIDGNLNLFTFVFLRCSSGLDFNKINKSSMIKVLWIFHTKNYTSYYDLIDASLKPAELLCLLHKLDIYVMRTTPEYLGMQKITLNNDSVSHLVKYLSKVDITHLIFAYNINEESNVEFSGLCCTYQTCYMMNEAFSRDSVSTNDIKQSVSLFFSQYGPEFSF